MNLVEICEGDGLKSIVSGKVNVNYKGCKKPPGGHLDRNEIRNTGQQQPPEIIAA